MAEFNARPLPANVIATRERIKEMALGACARGDPCRIAMLGYFDREEDAFLPILMRNEKAFWVRPLAGGVPENLFPFQVAIVNTANFQDKHVPLDGFDMGDIDKLSAWIDQGIDRQGIRWMYPGNGAEIAERILTGMRYAGRFESLDFYLAQTGS
jgi:hypothetical protein